MKNRKLSDRFRGVYHNRMYYYRRRYLIQLRINSSRSCALGRATTSNRFLSLRKRVREGEREREKKRFKNTGTFYPRRRFVGTGGGVVKNRQKKNKKQLLRFYYYYPGYLYLSLNAGMKERKKKIEKTIIVAAANLYIQTRYNNNIYYYYYYYYYPIRFVTQYDCYGNSCGLVYDPVAV